MTLDASILALKIVTLGGTGLWLALVSLNNVLSFRNGSLAIGRLMSMSSFDDAPKIDSPLLSRRTADARWHRLVYAVLLAIEIAVVALFANATIRYVAATGDAAALQNAMTHGNIAFAGLLIFCFVMLLGGTWFAYYVRQEKSQMTHLLLIAATYAGALVNNLA